MKNTICVSVIIVFAIFSCDNQYQFEKITNTNNLFYRAGPIEGAIFQTNQNDRILFDQNNYNALEKYIRKCELIISNFYNDDKSDLVVRHGWELIQNKLGNSQSMIGFLRFTVRKLSESRELTGANTKIAGEGIFELLKKIKKSTHLYKRIYEFKLSPTFQGDAYCYLFLSSENIWFNGKRPFTGGLSQEPKAIIFWFNIADDKIDIRNISFD